MAVEYSTHNSTGGGGSATLTTSLTPTGSDRLLLAAVAYYHGATSVLSVKFGGVDLEYVDSSQAVIGNYAVDLWALIAPAASTGNLVATFSAAPFDAGLTGVAFTGVHQTVPLGAPVTATGSSASPSVVVSSAADEMVMDGLIIVHNATLTVGANQTARSNATANGFVKRGCSTEPGASSVTMSWSNGSSADWAQFAVAIKPVSSGGFKAAWARHSNVLLRVS